VSILKVICRGAGHFQSIIIDNSPNRDGIITVIIDNNPNRDEIITVINDNTHNRGEIATVIIDNTHNRARYVVQTEISAWIYLSILLALIMAIVMCVGGKVYATSRENPVNAIK
jgi:hypothetical protein